MTTKISFEFNSPVTNLNVELIVITAFQGTDKKPILSHWPKDYQSEFKKIKTAKNFEASKGQFFSFYLENGTSVTVLGLGDKSKFTAECLRKEIAKLYHACSAKYASLSLSIDALSKFKLNESSKVIAEAVHLSAYRFDKYKSEGKSPKLKEVYLTTKEKKSQFKKIEEELQDTKFICESINIARDYVNEPPNILHSVAYAKEIEKDVKSNLKGVKLKILGKQEIKKEKMGMFLSVNAGSAHEPRLVHLTYTPKKMTKSTKHIALVGKGLTFDTGGYSLKPSPSMVNMKFDMAGSATMYAAFRAAVLTQANVKISCFLGITDNAVNEHATMPDAIVKARNGKTVEILNTDAEGRLVLGDVLDYACDQKPDVVIDAATLTGACLVALGTEICGLMGNNKPLSDALLKAAKECDEYMWELPIVDEFREDLKSNIADLKNIGGNRFAGTPKAAAFLENFIQPGVAWAHLDIAGVGDSQSHLPYCPKKGASGLIVRTLVQYLQNAK